MRPYFYIIYLQAEGDLQRSDLQRSDLQRSDLQALRADLQLSYTRNA